MMNKHVLYRPNNLCYLRCKGGSFVKFSMLVKQFSMIGSSTKSLEVFIVFGMLKSLKVVRPGKKMFTVCMPSTSVRTMLIFIVGKHDQHYFS